MDLKTQAKNAIRSYINGMDLDKSNRLPSEEKFANMIGVSRMTLRSALDELVNDKLIFRRQGKGTFVNIMSTGIKTSLNPVISFDDIIRNNNYKPSVRLLGSEIMYADKETAKDLNIPENSQVMVVKKIFYADQNLCAYSIDQFSKKLIDDSDISELNRFEDSIYQFLYAKTGHKACWEKVEIEAVDNIEIPELNRYLHLSEGKMKSFLCLKGINYDKMDAPLLRTFEYINTKIIKYNIIRHRIIDYCNKK